MGTESISWKCFKDAFWGGEAKRNWQHKTVGKMKQEERLMKAESEKYSIRTCRPGHITLLPYILSLSKSVVKLLAFVFIM